MVFLVVIPPFVVIPPLLLTDLRGPAGDFFSVFEGAPVYFRAFWGVFLTWNSSENGWFSWISLPILKIFLPAAHHLPYESSPHLWYAESTGIEISAMVEVPFTNRKTFLNHDLLAAFQQILHFSQYRKRRLPPVKIQFLSSAQLCHCFIF